MGQFRITDSSSWPEMASFGIYGNVYRVATQAICNRYAGYIC